MLYVMPAPVGAVTTIVPVATVQVGWTVTLAVGVDGNGSTVTAVAAEFADVHPFALVVFTVNDPLVFTVILCVVAPLLHVFPVAAPDVKTTEPSVQNLSSPPAEMVGVVGIGLIVTVVAAEFADVHPAAFVVFTVNVPLVFTVILCVVSPLLQLFPVAALDVSITLSFAQIGDVLFDVIVGVGN